MALIRAVPFLAVLVHESLVFSLEKRDSGQGPPAVLAGVGGGNHMLPACRIAAARSARMARDS